MTPIPAMGPLDHWWEVNTEKRRLDRNAGNMCMLIGLMLPALSIVLQGPVPNTALAHMPVWLQVAMCVCIFLGCGTKLHGALSGSRWWFPNTKLAKSYRWGYVGAPLAVVGCWVYGYYILSNSDTFLSAVGGVATPMFGLGVGIQAGFYWLESRRIDNREYQMLERAKNGLVP